MFVDVEVAAVGESGLKESGDVRRMDDYIFWNAGSEIGYYLALHVRPKLHALLSFFFFRSEKKSARFVELDTEDPSVLPGNSDVACICGKKPGLTPLR